MKPPRTTAHPSEDALQTACINRIRSEEYSGEVVNIHGGTAAQAGGHPDLIGCVRGRFVACELKQPGNVPTPRQYKRLRSWAAAGALVGWVTTEAEFVELLSHVDDYGWVNPDPKISRPGSK